MNIRFAFAVNEDNSFADIHFGDAYRFLFYEIMGEHIYFVETGSNIHSIVYPETHGNEEKGQSMVRYLREKNVNVIVSRKFGKNVDLIRKSFLPVLVKGSEPHEITKCLSKHIAEIKKILKNKPKTYNIIDSREWS